MSRASLLSPDAAAVAPAEGLRHTRRKLDAHLVSLLTPASFEAAQYRRLRLAIERLREAGSLRVLAVTSASPGDGKTLTTLNLAGALAQSRDLKVLVVDADLRRPALPQYLGVSAGQHAGLADHVHDERLSLADVVRRDPVLACDVILSGRQRQVAPFETLISSRVQDLLAEARARYDYVLLDTPPLLSVPDTQALASWVDGTVVVVHAHRTSKRQLAAILAEREALKMVGLVFNNDDGCSRSYDKTYYR